MYVSGVWHRDSETVRDSPTPKRLGRKDESRNLVSAVQKRGSSRGLSGADLQDQQEPARPRGGGGQGGSPASPSDALRQPSRCQVAPPSPAWLEIAGAARGTETLPHPPAVPPSLQGSSITSWIIL